MIEIVIRNIYNMFYLPKINIRSKNKKLTLNTSNIEKYISSVYFQILFLAIQ